MKQSDGLYIGLMSGTSIDGIDVALVRFTQQNCELVTTHNYSIKRETKQKLISLSSQLKPGDLPAKNRIELLAELDVVMGLAFSAAANELIELNQIDKQSIIAIGSHGQTIRHRPNNQHPFTLQIGDPNVIAEQTGIQTVADFRRSDIAAGGQGAPLAPAFHNAIMRSSLENRIILNLGGIANITFLPKKNQQAIIGFDTGTANTLLDAWYQKHHPTSEEDFDRDSLFANTGTANQELLTTLLEDPYFRLPFPKSTGREYFSLKWLENQIAKIENRIKPEDVQRTLVAFTVKSISNAIKSLGIDNLQIFACGGGMHNQFLTDSLAAELGHPVQTTNDIGVDGDYLEAMTFAWLAKRRIEALPGNIPSVTGANRPKILGAIYF